mgnify:CR=1 FL=1
MKVFVFENVSENVPNGVALRKKPFGFLEIPSDMVAVRRFNIVVISLMAFSS